MKTKIRLIIFFTVIFIVVFNLWKAIFPGPEIPVEGITNPQVETKEDVIRDMAETQLTAPTSEVTTESGPDPVESAYASYQKKFLPLAQKRDVNCSKAAEELFKDPSFIDIEDPFYKDPMNVIEGLHDVYTKTLVRPEVVDAYTSLSSILENGLYEGTPLTPGEYRNQMGLLEYYCRPEMSLRFIETVMEANKRYKFSPKMKKDIYDMSIGMLDSVIGSMYTTNNLIYGLGFFKLLIDNEMLPKEVGDEIVPLFDKVLEHHKGFTNTWQRDKEVGDVSALWSLLKEDHQRRVEFGSDFKELIGRLKAQYYVR